MHISFTEKAPAFVPATVVIEMYSHEISNFFYKIEDVTRTAEISFIPDYIPIIDATPKSTYKEISPGKIVTFDIDLENLGNAKTEFVFNVIDIPKGWSASILSNTAPRYNKPRGGTVKGEMILNLCIFSRSPGLRRRNFIFYLLPKI